MVCLIIGHVIRIQVNCVTISKKNMQKTHTHIHIHIHTHIHTHTHTPVAYANGD